MPLHASRVRDLIGRARSRCRSTGKVLFFEATPVSPPRNVSPTNAALGEALQQQRLGGVSSGCWRMARFTATTARRLRRRSGKFQPMGGYTATKVGLAKVAGNGYKSDDVSWL